MRNSEKEIKNRADMDSIILDNKIIHVAIHDDKYPYVLPLHYGYDTNVIYAHSSLKGKKMELLRKNSCIGFEISDSISILPDSRTCGFTTAFRSLVGTADCTVLEKDEDKLRGLNIIMRHITGKEWQIPIEAVRNTAVLAFSITKINGKISHIEKE